MKRPLTLLVAACFVLSTIAQDVQKCCGSSSSTFLLGSTDYARHTQCLYAPDELEGATDGYIVRMYYRYGISGITLGNTLGDVTIKLGQTTATAFSGVDFLTGLQTVLETASLSIAPGASGDWFSIDLTTPFEFDPTRSLVVDISFETSENTSFGTMSTSGNVGRKIMSEFTGTTSGESWDTLQDLGFDLSLTGMSERALTGAVLFPNPTSARVDLVWSEPLVTNATLTVHDASGRLVHTAQVGAGNTRTIMDLASLSSGLYGVQLRDGSGLLFSQRLAQE